MHGRSPDDGLPAPSPGIHPARRTAEDPRHLGALVRKRHAPARPAPGGDRGTRPPGAAHGRHHRAGRSVWTVALLRYLADPALRARVTAATNKVESYNGFSKWLGFGGVLADNDP